MERSPIWCTGGGRLSRTHHLPRLLDELKTPKIKVISFGEQLISTTRSSTDLLQTAIIIFNVFIMQEYGSILWHLTRAVLVGLRTGQIAFTASRAAVD
jgi:hypothetical protein